MNNDPSNKSFVYHTEMTSPTKASSEIDSICNTAFSELARYIEKYTVISASADNEYFKVMDDNRKDCPNTDNCEVGATNDNGKIVAKLYNCKADNRQDNRKILALLLYNCKVYNKLGSRRIIARAYNLVGVNRPNSRNANATSCNAKVSALSENCKVVDITDSAEVGATSIDTNVGALPDICKDISTSDNAKVDVTSDICEDGETANNKQESPIKWEVRKPSLTYQRKPLLLRTPAQNEASPCNGLSSSRGAEDSMEASDKGGIDFGPILKADPSADKHCITIQFPTCKTYSFEQAQDCMALKLKFPHLFDDGKNTALPRTPSRRSKKKRKHSRQRPPEPQKKSRPEPQKQSRPEPQKQCELCGLLYSCSRNSHLGSCKYYQSKVPCPDCGKILANAITLKIHREIHSRPVEKPYPCAICKKHFASRRTRSRHGRIHRGEKPHKCEICGRQFREKNQLTYHTTTHTGIKRITCPGCNKQFMYPSIMKLHKWTAQAVLSGIAEERVQAPIKNNIPPNRNAISSFVCQGP